MAMGMPSGRGRRKVPMSEINVTPMVDVMLVLLIIFMVTAPLLVTGVPVDLPDARAKALPADDTPIQISMDAQGRVFIDQLRLDAASLAPKLAAIRAARADQPRVYVRADKRLDYGSVMGVVGAISAAGFTKVALISDNRGGKPRAPAKVAAP